MRQHGTRAKYAHDKCRCDPCVTANRTYARQLQRKKMRVQYGIEEPSPAYIDASEARQHLTWLSSVGVGKRRISELTGIATTTIWKIRSGRLTKCRQSTSDKILGVGRSRAADGAQVDAKATWKRIDDLLANGWTKTAIARALGSKAKVPALQLSPTQVTAKHARAIEQLHETALMRALQDRRIATERRNHYRQLQREAA